MKTRTICAVGLLAAVAAIGGAKLAYSDTPAASLLPVKDGAGRVVNIGDIVASGTPVRDAAGHLVACHFPEGSGPLVRIEGRVKDGPTAQKVSTALDKNCNMRIKSIRILTQQEANQGPPSEGKVVRPSLLPQEGANQ
jgi:hypothetical protein